MTTVSDHDVDEAYERGLTAFVAHGHAHVTAIPRTGPRRRSALVAIVGLGIPLAALALGAMLIIANHTKQAPAPTSTATRGNAGLGHAVHISDSNGLSADVTVESVSYETHGAASQRPSNGFFAVADVLISTASPTANPDLTQKFHATQQTRNQLRSQLATALQANDSGRIRSLESSIAKIQQQLAQLTLQCDVLTFTFEARAGHNGSLVFGSSTISGFDPMLVSACGVPAGLTYGNVVFDIPSKGGVIRMTDPFSSTVGRWIVPPRSSTLTVRTAAIGHPVDIVDSQTHIASVTVEKVQGTTSGVDGARPRSGFYIIADVLISADSAIGSAAPEVEFTLDQATLNQHLAQLRVAVDANATARAATLRLQIARSQQELALLAQRLLPFTFVYETPDGHIYTAFSGNAMTSGWVPTTLGADATLPEGLTSLRVVFDVPSANGAIRMSDPFSPVIEQWMVPAG